MSSSLDCASLWLQLFSLILSVPWCVSVSITPASCPCLYLFLSHFQFSVSTCRFVLSCPFSLSSLLSASGCPVASTFSLSICLDILPPHRFFSRLTPSLYFHPLCFSLSLLLTLSLSFLLSSPVPRQQSRQRYWELAAVSNGDILTQCSWCSKDINSGSREPQSLLMALSNCSCSCGF